MEDQDNSRLEYNKYHGSPEVAAAGLCWLGSPPDCLMLKMSVAYDTHIGR